MKKLSDQETGLYELISGWKINHTLLAKKMDMPMTTFNNKLHPNQNGRFTEEELRNLASILLEISGSIDNYVMEFA